MKVCVAVTMGLVLTLVIVGAMVSCKKSEAPQQAQSGGQTAQTSTEALPQPNPERNVYFGETHLHTSWSLDAWVFGNHLTGPDDAYKYAQGQTIKHPLAYPLVEGGFDPVRNGHGTNVATLANQVNYGPMSSAHLDVVQLQADEFRSAKPQPNSMANIA